MPDTAFEQSIASSSRYVTLHDEDGVTVLGYYRSSGGYEEIRDREGTIVWSDEVGLEQPLLSPIDLVGPGLVRVGVRLTSRIIARITARTAAGGASRAAGGLSQVLTRLRAAARNLVARAGGGQATRTLAQQAETMVAAARQAGRQVVVNLGGTGEVAGAINVNPLLGQQVRAVPNLIRAGAERVGSLFRSGSVDRVVSNDVVRGQCNWLQAARGAFQILRSRGQVSIAPYAGQLAEHLAEIATALRAAGFQNVQTVAGRFVTAIRP